MASSASSFSDDYEVISELRRGRFGQVLKVKSEKSGKIYARREFEEQLVVERGDVENEINTLKNLDNRRVVKLSKFDRNHILMEFCDLGDLDNYVRRNGSLETKEFMEDMISGLSFLHGKELTHGDLKPANVLLQSDPGNERPICKISDFGMWKFVRPNTPPHPGSQYYIAPGVGTGPYKKEYDVFSLGAIFFVLFTKQTLESGDKAYLAPTIGNIKLPEVMDEETAAHVTANRIATPPHYGELIIQMLKHNDGCQFDIDKVKRMFFGKQPGSSGHFQDSDLVFPDSRENRMRARGRHGPPPAEPFQQQ